MAVKVVAVEVASFEFAETTLIFLAEVPRSNTFFKHTNLSESPLLRLTPSKAARLCDELVFGDSHSGTTITHHRVASQQHSLWISWAKVTGVATTIFEQSDSRGREELRLG